MTRDVCVCVWERVVQVLENLHSGLLGLLT